MHLVITLTEEEIRKLENGEEIDTGPVFTTNLTNFQGVILRKEEPKEDDK